MLKYDNTANIASARKKIDSLRTMFYKEHKKVQTSESGTSTGADEVYVPNWVHYNELRFLSEVQRPARHRFSRYISIQPDDKWERPEGERWRGDGRL